MAGILMHMAKTGMFSGMPDLTIIRAGRPSSVPDVDVHTQTWSAKTEPIPIDEWLLRKVGGATTVRVPLNATDKDMTKMGAAMLADGAKVQVVQEDNNPFAPKGMKALQVQLAGGPCGYVANCDLRKVRPGEATVFESSSAASGWELEALAAVAYTIEVDDDWTLEGELVEVKSAKDSLWTEQKMWLRALLEPEYLHYDNPYLFTTEGKPVVKISTCRVKDPKGAAEGSEASTSNAVVRGAGRGRGGGGRGSRGRGKKSKAEAAETGGNAKKKARVITRSVDGEYCGREDADGSICLYDSD